MLSNVTNPLILNLIDAMKEGEALELFHVILRSQNRLCVDDSSRGNILSITDEKVR
jgi:hypothetical protein